MAFELKTKVGDRTTWTFTLEDADGAVDLTASIGIVIYTRLWDGSTNKIDGSAVTKDPDQVTNPGKCTYAPTAGDVDTEGIFKVEVVVTWAGPKDSVFPSNEWGRLEIDEALA
jgi:hypothetical protein